MKKIGRIFIWTVALLFCTVASYAHHIKGGWIGYKYVGQGTSVDYSQYEITVYLYIDCNNSQGFRDSVILGIFDAGTKTLAFQKEIPKNSNNIMSKQSFGACITNKPDICYNVYTYTTTVNLPINSSGYDVNVQFRARVDDIVNIYNSGNTGITLFTQIPGKIIHDGNTLDAYANTSPQFNFLDTSVVCHSSRISIPFSAIDPDGDSLSYAFGTGNDASGSNNVVLVPPTPPPYPLLDYKLPYSGQFPLGPNVSINPTTGLITGTAPQQTGEYVVAVYAQEWRNGILIATTKKELQINVTDCSLQYATLNPSYINCKDYNFTFKNNSSVANATYMWDFGVPNTTHDTSSVPDPTFNYPDTGTYALKLKVQVSSECIDSATSEIKVYPGFFPGFSMLGNCILASSRFNDTTTTKSGTVDSWQWNFGDNTTSTIQNPTHQFQQPGDYQVSLLVGNSKGCSDTISHTFTVFNSLHLQPLFTDTTICYKDSVQLVVNSPFAKSYQWSPSLPNILNASTNTPTVFPTTNTEYTLTAKNEDCVESVKVNVNLLKEVNVIANDLYACIGDSATFNIASQATKYDWTLLTGTDVLNDNTLKQPSLLVNGNDSYHILATYGSHCTAEKTVQVLSAPYPVLKIQTNKDTSICLGNSLQLEATGNTTENNWTPTNQKGNTITVKPEQTTTYVIDGSDVNSYCSKHIQDTIIVKVAPKFRIYMTADTSIVWKQPLTIIPKTNQADRKYSYTWTPNNYLNNTDSALVIATIPKGIGQQFYTLNMKDASGCIAAAQIAVHIFQTQTDIFVPSAFTPNNDGKNDIVRPILAGIKELNYFRIYNRWGQLVYSTQTPGQGWDGYVNGQLQPDGSTYVYRAAGKDYNDKKIEKSGTIVLIR